MKGVPATRLEERLTKEVVVVRAQGDFLVHLKLDGRTRTLCGQALRARPPHKSFRQAGCAACRTAALEGGQLAAREGDRTWINLQRV